MSIWDLNWLVPGDEQNQESSQARQTGALDEGSSSVAAPSGAGAGWPASEDPEQQYWIKVGDTWRYMVHPGLTISGLAATYLLSPARWRDIWRVQRAEVRAVASPDSVPLGVLLDMPDEAVQRAQVMGVLPSQGVAAPGAPAKPADPAPADLPPPPATAKKKSNKVWIAAVGAAVVGLLMAAGGS